MESVWLVEDLCRWNPNRYASKQAKRSKAKQVKQAKQRRAQQAKQTSKQATNQANNYLTPWGRVLLEKLTVPQPVKKFLAFYDRVHMNPPPVLYQARSIQALLHQTFLKSMLILFPTFTPTSTKCSLSLMSPHQILHAPLPSSIRAICPAHLIKTDNPQRISSTFGVNLDRKMFYILLDLDDNTKKLGRMYFQHFVTDPREFRSK